MTEVTQVSELWRDAEPFPDLVREGIQDRLYAYVTEVVASDWASMAVDQRHSGAASAAYRGIWDAYYTFEPGTPIQAAFYAASVQELNEFGRARRQRSLYASTQVPPPVRLFLIGGGVMTVLFSLLIPAKSVTVQCVATSLMSGLIAFSIFIALSLESPFSGDLSLSPTAFEEIIDSFEARSEGRVLRSGLGSG